MTALPPPAPIAEIEGIDRARFDAEIRPAEQPVVMRGLDHQGTLGTWVGETTLRGRQGAMKNIRYADGANYLFPEAEVRAARPRA